MSEPDASKTMVAYLLHAAESLLSHNPRSSAFRRRAVSTAYYAVFHALSKACADTLLASASHGRDSDEYAKVYRALDHGPLRQVFEGAVKKDRRFERIANLAVSLQSERFKADYSPPVAGVFSRAQVEQLIEQARQAVREIEALNADDRATLAAHLLFKKR